MPPKAARGAARGRGEPRGRGDAPRGRGRGRGRGKAAAAPAADTPAAPEAQDQEADSQSTIVDSPMQDAEPAANTTPIHEREQNDPNVSPATQPTETPAPTPIRQPPVSPNTNGAAASGSGTRGSGAAKPSKFKPRIVRAGAKEREEREERERERENARLGVSAAAAARESRTWGRGGRGGRGRGDAMGRGRGAHISGTASGPFASIPAGGDKRGFFAGGGGAKRETGSYTRGSGGGASGSGIKTDGGAFSVGALGGSHDTAAARYMPDPQYPDEDEDSPRVDIEHINRASDSEDEDVAMAGFWRSKKAKGKVVSNHGGMKPIRLDRKEHKERVTIVNTENTVKSEDDNDPDVMVVDDGHSSKADPQKRQWTGTYEEEVQIKAEPGVIPGMTYSSMPAPSSPPPSKFNIPAKVGDDEPEFEMDINQPEPLSPRTDRRAKSRVPTKRKEKMPVIQTEEDRAEWQRHLEDMDVLRDELVGLATHLDPQNKDKDVEGDVEMRAAAAQENGDPDRDQGRIYIFQFPPVLPKLFDHTTDLNPNVKQDDDVQLVETLDLTKENGAEVKAEEKAVEIKQEELDAEEQLKRQEREALVVDEGAIGRLIVRESGQVELVWGGTNMKVRRGVATEFWSDGILVDGMDKWIKDEKGKDVPIMQDSRGISLSMAEVMGKFVVTPDWANTH